MGDDSQLVEALCDEKNFAKKKLVIKDLRAIVRVIHEVVDRAEQIGAELQVNDRKIRRITQVVYKGKPKLWYIAILAEWLNGNYDGEKPPYTLHVKEEQHPSWWNLFYAVAKQSGGNDYQLVQGIQDYQSTPQPKQEYCTGDLSTAFTKLKAGDPKTPHEITAKTQGVWEMWYQIGIVLGVSISELEGILTNGGDNESNFKEMIRCWIKVGARWNEKPCWKHLLMAIDAGEGGGKPAFADDLTKTVFPVYCIDLPETSDATLQEIDSIKFHRYQPYGRNDALRATSIKLTFDTVPVEKGQKHDTNNCYEMAADSHGLCIIISNKNFSPPLECTENDERNLVQCFRYLGYIVEVHRDCTAQQIKAVFSYYNRHDCDYRSYHSLVVCVLSHGDENTICGIDGRGVALRSIAEECFDAITSISFKGKPKLFFIDTCRVEAAKQKKQKWQSELERELKACELAVHIKADGTGVTIPISADFFFGFPTSVGKYSYSNDTSWYTTELCRGLCAYARYLDFNSIIVGRVHNRVAKGEKYKDMNFKQQPEERGKLNHKLFFF